LNFSSELRATISRKLFQEEQGRCTSRHGYILAVINIENIGAGRIKAGTGYAYFTVVYKAIVFKPFRGEVIDGIVSDVHAVGLFANIGPTRVFVSNKAMPDDYMFDPNSDNPCFTSGDQTVRIKKGDHIRLRIEGIKMEEELACIGSIKDDYLGYIPN